MFVSKGRQLLSLSTQLAMKAKTIILCKKFEGYPTEHEFRLVEEPLRPLKDGEFLAQAEYISVDPYMRTQPVKVGQVIRAQQVAKILDSKSTKYPTGEYVVGEFGWRTHSIASDTPQNARFPQQLLKDYTNLPRSLALGALGMPGNTAYFGLLKICKPEVGNTVVVSGAGGAVGSLAGQIAKIKGCRVVGITGSDENGHRLVNDFNFDAFVNYNSTDFIKELAEATRNGIDCYFDNVGGEISSVILQKMNKFGRVVICGVSSEYNSTDKATEVQTPIKIAHVKMEGMSVTRFIDQWDEGVNQNLGWIKSGDLKYAETVTEGFENTPSAFIDIMRSKGFGKAVVKV